MSAVQSDIQHIPLDRLSVSIANARRTERKADIEPLAASIAAHGLLQNLTVTSIEDERFGVVAGGRRLAALQLLAKRGEIAKECAIPCQVITAEAAAETSLAENVQRVAMNVMDEVEAFAGLVENGASIDDVARRFGSTIRHVEQRLALARLSPRIRTAYRKGDVTLDVARAFCITDSHTSQERVFKSLSKPINHASSVRQALTQGRIPASDKLAKFVGLDAYETAGGRITRDLFEDGIVFLEESDLLQRLASEKIEALRDQVLAEGWGWTETQLGHGSIDGCAGERLYPKARRLTAEQKKEAAALEATIEAIDSKLDAEEGDETALLEERAQAEDKLDALRESALTWDAKQIGHAGALIAIDYNGKPTITRGLIKRADLKALNKLRNARSAAAKEGEEESGDQQLNDAGPRFTKSLTKQLTQARTRGLRSALAHSPHVALALAVHVLLRESANRIGVPGIGLRSRPAVLDDNDSFERQRIACAADAPEDDAILFAACLDMSIETLLASLAVLIAETADFGHEGGSPSDRAMQKMSDALASALDLDMTQFWEADQDFFASCPKPLTLTALASAPSITVLGEAERSSTIADLGKMKKAELARAAADKLRDTGWLPDLLVTPLRAGAIAITGKGKSALADAA